MLSGKDVNVGDFFKLILAHPCGSDEWDITRTGMDFGMKCCGCGHLFGQIGRAGRQCLQRPPALSWNENGAHRQFQL